MPWWGWMIFGLLLLGSELLIVDAAFYLVFIGIAAILTGAIALTGLVPEPWVQWLLFSVIAVVSMIWFRRRLYAKFRGTVPEYKDGLAGQRVRLEQTLEPGQSCRQSFRGTDWTIVNRGGSRLDAQSEVEIDSTDGLTIIVKGN